jgi:hypothetical protein
VGFDFIPWEWSYVDTPVNRRSNRVDFLVVFSIRKNSLCATTKYSFSFAQIEYTLGPSMDLQSLQL